jgi:type IV pilus assembly protein PilA
MSEAVSLMSGGKTPLAEYFADKGIWPSTAGDVMGNTAGKYTNDITLSGATNTQATLTATMKSSGVNTNIQSKTVLLSTADGGKNWICSVGTVDPKYVPGACK